MKEPKNISTIKIKTINIGTEVGTLIIYQIPVHQYFKQIQQVLTHHQQIILQINWVQIYNQMKFHLHMIPTNCSKHEVIGVVKIVGLVLTL